jgi:uncharacterized protein YciI
MFIISLKYIAPLEELDRHMEAHIKYLKKYYAADVFIMSSRKVPRTGGIIIAQADSKEIMEKIIADDPFSRHKLAEFEITEFLASQSHPDLKDLLK